MKESTRKLITWLGLGVAIIAAILSFIFAMNNGGIKDLAEVKNGWSFDLTYYILLCLVAISIIAIIWFLCLKLAKNFKEQKGYAGKFLMLVAIIVVVCVVSFLLSSGNDINAATMEKFNISEGTSKLIGAACILVYILVIAAAVSIVYTAIAKSLKK